MEGSVHLPGTARGTVRALDIAARSVFESQAWTLDVESVVAERALDHHWAGLFQYAAIRCGATRAALLLKGLELTAHALAAAEPARTDDARADAAAPADEAKPTSIGPGARLYRALRTQIGEVERKRLAADSTEWWVPLDAALASQVVALRRALSDAEAEVLELIFVRGLNTEEAAHVIGSDLEEVTRLSRSALARADQLLATVPRGDETREAVLVQVFALDPRRIQSPPRRARAPVLPTGAVIGNRYEIEALLGAGAFADVYRARDREVTDHVVALKILRGISAGEDAVQVAMRELQLIASVFHPSIVQLKDHGWHEGHLWFVMPLYRGETLATRLLRGPLTRREAREIFEPLAEALTSMHRALVRHQDIKPENVFLAQIDPEADTASRRVLPVLLDLGVAAKDAELVLAGTPAYFAPEVAARFVSAPDPPPVGPKADVFSLALTLRQALDPSPEQDVTAAAVDAFIAHRAFHAPGPPRRRDLRDLASVFERWLNLSPDARPTADEFRRELALLTRAEEQRQRRLALMRWVIPTVIGTLAAFAGVVHNLSAEASLRRVEAEQARTRATQARERVASIHASLEVEEARRRGLEADIATLKEEYRNSKLTREQLASRLATVEGEFSMLSEREKAEAQKLRQQGDLLHDAREEKNTLVQKLDAVTLKRNELAGELDRARSALESERGRRTDAETLVETLKLQVRAAERVIDDTRARINELETRQAEVQSPIPSDHAHAARPISVLNGPQAAK